MYEYVDFYDEAMNGSEEGEAIMMDRDQVIKKLKEHGHIAPSAWFEFFKDTGMLCSNSYPAVNLLSWLGY